MGYADRHLWSQQFDASTTGDKAYFGVMNRVTMHKVAVVFLDAGTGAGEVVVDKLDASAGTRGSADIATLTVGATNAAGAVLYEEDLDGDVLDIGDVAIFEVTDAVDALMVALVEYSINDDDMANASSATAV